MYMRHVQLKHIWGCSQLKALQPLEKNHHRHLRRNKLAYPICQEFTGLLHKPLYHGLLHMNMNDMNVWPSRASVIQRSEDCMAVIPGCIQDVWAPAITWLSVGPTLSRPHVDGHCCAAVWCHWWVCPDVCSLSWSAAHDALDSDSLHCLCYVIWHPEAGVLWYPAGPLATDLSPGVPSLNCAGMSSVY